MIPRYAYGIAVLLGADQAIASTTPTGIRAVPWATPHSHNRMIDQAHHLLMQARVRDLCEYATSSYPIFQTGCRKEARVAPDNTAWPIPHGTVRPSAHADTTPKLSRRLLDSDEAFRWDWTSLILAFLCVLCAAFCAGLIMGILSLDELQLHIKIRAGSDPEEQRYANRLLPLVQQRHLVLVSLLLLNFLADEVLPLCLDNVMPTWMAVLTSVVLVVFVSEIIPSAVFIGPDQLRLASQISPFAYAVIYLFYPIAYPIALLLDYLLKGEDELGNQYNRGELSALVRIQYEGRLAAKRRELKERRMEQGIAGLDDDESQLSDIPPSITFQHDTHSIQTTEVNMMQGALALKTTNARDVCTKIRKAYTVIDSMVLDSGNVARIYGVGYSRVPVYQRNQRRPRDITGIVGILLTRQLILIQPEHRRPVSSLPLYQPVCVGPEANMIELLQMFQGGSAGNKGGHMALVCERPGIATTALDQKKAIPPEAGVIGIITMEDVIEELLQEPIYDEGDREEREEMERAEWAFRKWRLFVKLRRRQRELLTELESTEGTPLLTNHKMYNTPTIFRPE
jgi:metal transporter CNNM